MFIYRKNKAKIAVCWIPLLLSLIGLAAAVTTTQAQLLEEIDAETGDWSQWRAKVSGTENHTIVTDPVCAGNYAYKWTHTGGRTESAARYHPIDTDLWYGFAMYLSPNFSTERNQSNCVGGASVAQIHGYHPKCPSGDRAIAMLRIDDGQFKWWLKRMGEVGGCYERLAPAKKGEWLHFVVNAKLTTNGSGYFKCWLNGELILEEYGSSWSSCTQGAYFKMGTYASTRSGDWMLGDEIRVGRSRDVVDPANYCGASLPSVPVASVLINNCPSGSVPVGSSTDLNAMVAPDNATNKVISWTSSNASVATVNEQGIVSAVGEGRATITVTTQDGGFTSGCVITVVSDGGSGCTESNLALGGNIHSVSGAQSGNPASNLIDGVSNTDANRWSSNGYPQWVILDLGSAQSVEGVSLQAIQQRSYRYEVYASESLSAVQNKANNARVVSSTTQPSASFASTSARYVRVEVSGAEGYSGSWVSLREIAVQGSCEDGGGQRDAYTTTQAEDYDSEQGTQLTNNGTSVGFIEDGDYLIFNQVDFGSGAASVNVQASSATSGGRIEFRLGGVSGTEVGEVVVSNTGSWTNYQAFEGAVSGAQGLQDVYVVFEGGSGFLLDVDSFVFSEDEGDTPPPSGSEGTISIRAKGDCDSETMVLEVDGQEVDRWANVSTRFSDYAYDNYNGGQIAVAFVNDQVEGCDRNLEVDYVTVCGIRYETETQATETATCCTNIPDKLFTNGNFNFGDVGCSNNAQPDAASARLAKRPVAVVPEELIVYPNPTTNSVFRIKSSIRTEYVVTNLSERVVTWGNTATGIIDLSGQPKGVYLLRIAQGTTLQTIKLIKK